MKKINKLTFLLFFMGGMVLATVGLISNQMFPIEFAYQSFLSPTGGSATIGGIHLKHWISGLIILLIGVYYYFTNNKYLKYSSFAMGFGLLLVIDELDDISNFISTGEL